MASSTFPTRLINEAKQSPGKAIFLAVGAAFALYMWAPLIFPANSPATQPTAATTKANAESTQTKASSDATDEARWYQQYQDFQATRLLEPWKPEAQNGLSPVESGVENVAAALAPEDEKKLTLTAVLFGGRTGNLANLNGKVVREGDEVWIDFAAKTSAPTYHRPQSSPAGRWMLVKIKSISENQIEVDVGGDTCTIHVRPKSN